MEEEARATTGLRWRGERNADDGTNDLVVVGIDLDGGALSEAALVRGVSFDDDDNEDEHAVTIVAVVVVFAASIAAEKKKEQETKKTLCFFRLCKNQKRKKNSKNSKSSTHSSPSSPPHYFPAADTQSQKYRIIPIGCPTAQKVIQKT